MESGGAFTYYVTGIGDLNVDLGGAAEYLLSTEGLDLLGELYATVKAKGSSLVESIMGKNKKKTENKYPKCELTGLKNLGNTCFMNSTIQTLFMCEQFCQEVLQNVPKPNQTVMAELRTTFGCLLESKGAKAYNPSRFLELARPPWFDPKCQQDSSEFLRYLLNLLHEEEQECTSNETVVKNMFGGLLEHAFACIGCETSHSTEEMFLDITLTLPRDNYEKKVCFRELINQFCEKELIKGGYYCDGCKCLQSAWRKTTILKYPKYLIFSLMRFTNYGREKYHTKNLSPIDYPRNFHIKSSGIVFDLKGAIIHSGRTPHSGHYYCYSRGMVKVANDDDQQWFLFNDSSVYPTCFESLKETYSNTLTHGTSCVVVYSQVRDKQEEMILPPDLRKIIASRPEEQKVEVYNRKRKTTETSSNDNENKKDSRQIKITNESSEKETKTKARRNNEQTTDPSGKDNHSTSNQRCSTETKTKTGRNTEQTTDPTGNDNHSASNQCLNEVPNDNHKSEGNTKSSGKCIKSDNQKSENSRKANDSTTNGSQASFKSESQHSTRSEDKTPITSGSQTSAESDPQTSAESGCCNSNSKDHNISGRSRSLNSNGSEAQASAKKEKNDKQTSTRNRDKSSSNKFTQESVLHQASKDLAESGAITEVDMQNKNIKKSNTNQEKDKGFKNDGVKHAEVLKQLAEHVCHDIEYLRDVLWITDDKLIDETKQQCTNPRDVALRLLQYWIECHKSTVEKLQEHLKMFVQERDETGIKDIPETKSSFTIPDFTEITEVTVHILAEVEYSYWKDFGEEANIDQFELRQIGKFYEDDVTCANYEVLVIWMKESKAKYASVDIVTELKRLLQNIGAFIDVGNTIEQCVHRRKLLGNIPSFSCNDRDALTMLAKHTSHHWKRLGQALNFPRKKLQCYWTLEKNAVKSCLYMLEALPYQSHVKRTTQDLKIACMMAGFQVHCNLVKTSQGTIPVEMENVDIKALPESSIQVLSEHIGSKWKELGMELKLSDYILNSIGKQYIDDNKACQAMLRDFRHIHSENNREKKILEALTNTGIKIKIKEQAGSALPVKKMDINASGVRSTIETYKLR